MKLVKKIKRLMKKDETNKNHSKDVQLQRKESETALTEIELRDR